MCEVEYCGSRCRLGKCSHPKFRVHTPAEVRAEYGWIAGMAT